MRRAKRFANENVRQLSSIVSAEEPLICIEPSAILGFRDEYPALVDPEIREAARQLAPHCLMLDEFIAHEADAGRIDSGCFTDEARTIHVHGHGHCHQKAMGSVQPTLRMLSLPAPVVATRSTTAPEGSHFILRRSAGMRSEITNNPKRASVWPSGNKIFGNMGVLGDI